MLRWLPLVALSSLSSPLPRDDVRFDAAGSAPKWRLMIEGGNLEWHQLKPRRDRRSGYVGTITRGAGMVRIDGAIVIENLIPMGTSRSGQPLVFVESEEEPLSIEVTEAPCRDEQRNRTSPTRVVVTLNKDYLWRGCGDSLAVLDAGLTKAR